MMSVKQKIRSQVDNVAKQIAFKVNLMLNNYRDVIWLVGAGRSGTTWVSDLINHDQRYRQMFEPFHPKKVPDADFIVPHQYIRPNAVDEKLLAFASRVFDGRFTHARVDCGNQSFVHKGLLIKDIFANLLFYSVSRRFQQVKPVLLIRNPFAVALSKYKKKHLFWVTEPLDLLRQEDLFEDYLYQFEDVIRETSARNDYILNQIVIWSIINHIPLRQFEPESIHTCFYETIYSEPNREISELFKFVRGNADDVHTNIDEETIRKPSRVAGANSNVSTGTSPVLSWKKELNPRQIDDGLRILQQFGFDGLYDDRSMPHRDVLKRIHQFA